jgi:hypothetical protein
MSKAATAGPLTTAKGPDRMVTSMASWRERHAEHPISREVSVDHGLLDRDELLKMLDQAVNKRLTVISAPPGSGKTSRLRAWADRAIGLSRVAFVSVDRDEQNAQRFWSVVLDHFPGRGAGCADAWRGPDP